MRQSRLFRFGAWLIPASVTIVLMLLISVLSATALAGTRCGFDVSKYNYDANADLAPGNFAPTAVAVVASGSCGGVVGISNGVGSHGYNLSRSKVAPRTPGNDFQVIDPLNLGRTITDIGTFRPGQLVGLKLATSAADPQAWIQKHIVRKAESYLVARQHMPGCEQSDIVFEFTKPGVDPAFMRSVNEAVTGLDATTPGVNIAVRWAP